MVKKILLGIVLVFISAISINAFKIEVDLANEEYGQQLFLYSNGKCVVTGPNNLRGSGTYDIQGSTIYIEWDNGVSQQGKYLPTGGRNGHKRVCIEGVCYDEPRKVVPRR